MTPSNFILAAAFVSLAPTVSSLSGERSPAESDADYLAGDRRIPILQGEFPFLARVTNYRDNASCMGSLIAPDVVLTAAHCVEPSRDVSVFVDGNYRESVHVEVHPSYRQDDEWNHRSDLAKVHLNEPVHDVDPVSFHTGVLAGDIGVSVDRLYKVPVEVKSSGRVIRAGDPMGYVVKGDSGGPLLFWTLNGWSQAGVVSKTHESGWG